METIALSHFREMIQLSRPLFLNSNYQPSKFLGQGFDAAVSVAFRPQFVLIQQRILTTEAISLTLSQLGGIEMLSRYPLRFDDTQREIPIIPGEYLR